MSTIPAIAAGNPDLPLLFVSATFMAVFAGGHFYWRSAEGEFMPLLRSSLAALADSARETAAQS